MTTHCLSVPVRKKMKDFKVFGERPTAPGGLNIPVIKPPVDFVQFKTEEIEQSVSRCFEVRSARHPHRVAVKTGDGAYTYRRLNECANRIARLISASPDTGGGRAALLLGHDVGMVTGILAALKAGRCYIPLEPEYPVARSIYILKDAAPGVLVTDNRRLEDARALLKAAGREKNTPLVNIDELPKGLPADNPATAATPGDPAYILYTSGSTGNPKGVVQNHRNVLHFARVYTNALRIHPNDRLTLFSSYSFDAAQMDIYGALLNGAALYPQDIKTQGGPLQTTQWLNRENITIFHSIPTLYRYITGALDGDGGGFGSIRFVVLGGEAVGGKDLAAYKRYFPDHCVFINGLGPTESTVTLQYVATKNTPHTGETVPVGVAADQTDVFLVNGEGLNGKAGKKIREVRGFGRGEFVFKSRYLALGYANLPEKTAAMFTRDPLGGRGRVYRGGDLGRRRPDGTFEYAGRRDFQVKIRGYRVEPGEIEARLDRAPGIQKSVVVFVNTQKNNHENDIHHENHLVAFYLAGDEPGNQEKNQEKNQNLVRYLEQFLPDYMIPSFFFPLDCLPLTATGKIDRGALIARAGASGFLVSPDREPPRPGTETLLAQVWARLLDLETVGARDHFFRLGGNSLKAMNLSSMLQCELGYAVPLRALFAHPTPRELAQYIDKTIEKTIGGDTGNNGTNVLSEAEEREYYPLSPAQERLYILQRMDVRGTVYNMPRLLPLESKPDMETLTVVFRQLIRRHESLRTSFHLVGDAPVQIIHPRVEFRCQVEKKEKNDRYQVGKNRYQVGKSGQRTVPLVRPFDLGCAPLLRVTLIKNMAGEYFLLVDIHHIVSDGISNGILFREFNALYRGENPSPPKLRYRDYVLFQRGNARQGGMEIRAQYWRKRFDGPLPVLELPQDHPRPGVRGFTGDYTLFRLEEDISRGIRALARRRDATLFMVLTALFNLLLFKLSGSEDIVVGTAESGRGLPGTENTVGMFVNTLALRNFPVGRMPFVFFLNNVKNNTLRDFENRDYPFEALVDYLSPTRDTSRNPLFDVMFSMQEAWEGDVETGDVETSSPGPATFFERGVAKFDLTFSALDVADVLDIGHGGIRFSVEYGTELFEEVTILRFVRYFKAIAAAVTENPGVRLCEVDILSPEEKRQLVIELNNCNGVFDHVFGHLVPAGHLVQDIFTGQAGLTPDCVALAPGTPRGAHRTYAHLAQVSDELAGRLKKRGVGPGGIVAVMTDFSNQTAEPVTAILAILKTNSAYLSLDSTLPPERIRLIKADSGVGFAVVTGKNRIISLREANDPVSNISRVSNISNIPVNIPAYVLYTSGTTGVPRGVVVGHRSLVNYLRWAAATYVRDRAIHFPFFTPLAFDLTVTSIFVPIVTGGSVIIYGEPGKSGQLERLTQIFRDPRIGAVKLTPAHLKIAVEILQEPVPCAAKSTIQCLVVGGEAFPASLAHVVHRAFGGLVQIYNEYGPTEATVGCTVYLHTPTKTAPRSQTLPIGRPVSGTGVLILDSFNRHCLPGIAGELIVYGAGIAQGYLNNPEHTAQMFHTCPIAGPGGASPWPPEGRRRPRGAIKTYKTGDLARQLPDGDLEYLGRLDGQVKIRGYRIEPEEIAACLTARADIRRAVVVLRSGSGQLCAGQLCAYVVPDGPVEMDELRAYLVHRLPEYMVPAHFVSVPRIPLTVNGKLNIRGLPAPGPEKNGEALANRVAPRSDTEKILSNLWNALLVHRAPVAPPAAQTSLLQRMGEPVPAFSQNHDSIADSIAIDQDFFHLGGDSLKATILCARVKHCLGVDLPLVEVFKNPTIRGLATWIDRERGGGAAAEDPLLVLLRRGSGDETIFFIHDGTGEVDGYVEFCRGLHGPWHCWGIRAPRSTEDLIMERPIMENPTIETLAARYINAMKKIQPGGPYILAGWSLGGMAAFEATRQLEKKGEAVRGLVLFDSPPPGSGDTAESDSILLNARARYRPRGTVNAPVYHFVARQSQETNLQRNWKKYTGGPVFSYLVPGNHYTMFRTPHVTNLSKSFEKNIINMPPAARRRLPLDPHLARL